MPVESSSVSFPAAITQLFSDLKARFTAFVGRVSSALKSIGRNDLGPIRPLQTRTVVPAPPPSSPAVKALRTATPPVASGPDPEEKAFAELKPTLHKNLHAIQQQALNQEITSFDPGKLKSAPAPKASPETPVSSEYAASIAKQDKLNQEISSFDRTTLKPTKTKESSGLPAAKLEQQLSGPQDNIALHPAKLPEPAQQPELLPEPHLSDIKDGLKTAVSTAALADFAAQVSARIAKLESLPTMNSPEAKQLNAELKVLADQLGDVIGDLYRQQPQERQDSLAASMGTEFQQELWQLLQGANGKLPAWNPQVDGDGNLVATPTQRFLDQIVNRAASHLDTRMGEGETPTLTFQGKTFEMVKLLGVGGGGRAYLYESADGHRVVVKSRGFGPDYELMTSGDKQAMIHELKTHLALMKADPDALEHLLQIRGVARTPLGQPVAILDLAENGDLVNVIGKAKGPAKTTADKGEKAAPSGRLAQAVQKGLVSPQAEHLVKLLILRDSIQGISAMQQQFAARHGDFKGGNLFLGAKGIVKVADFGLTSLPGTAKNQATEGQGTPAYMAPELLMPGTPPTGKADTWAIGVFAYELFKGQMPFGTIDDDVRKQVADYVAKGDLTGARAVLTKLAENHSPDAVVVGITSVDRLINAMLHRDPDQRPSLEAVLSSSLFDDLGHGLNDLSPEVRELLDALSSDPLDEDLIKAKSSALGI